MLLPPLPGVYVVELLNEEPISVKADRPAISDRCIKVTRANCKYGRAVNLARRQRDYQKTFGQHNVRFRFFVATDQYVAIEAMIGQKLASYRVPGPSGRASEWLQGIGPDEVEKIVKAVLAALPLDLKPLSNPPRKSITSRSKPVEPLGVSPASLVEAADYLEKHRMPLDLLRALHHSPRRDETFASTRRYFSKKHDLHHKNQLYGARLMFIADEHRSSGRPFEELAHEALNRHPP